VAIHREEHWDGIPPGGDRPLPIRLPVSVEDDEVFVPAGWFSSGGDPSAFQSAPQRRAWVAAFTITRFPVTNAQYVAFLDDLIAQGREAEALSCVPRDRGAGIGAQGAPMYGRDEGGRFLLRPDLEGDVWHPDWPVCNVNWFGASAYGRWMEARTGLPWRLPSELEWEKAARGVDGRFFPWGDQFDASWCCAGSSHRGRRLPATVHDFPVDESPWGMRGAAGNMSEWCLDRFRHVGAVIRAGRASLPPQEDLEDAETLSLFRVCRGGSWDESDRRSRVADRIRASAQGRRNYIGLRLA